MRQRKSGLQSRGNCRGAGNCAGGGNVVGAVRTLMRNLALKENNLFPYENFPEGIGTCDPYWYVHVPYQNQLEIKLQECCKKRKRTSDS